MSKRIDLGNSEFQPISLLGESGDAELGITKGWSFINIYDLLEFRNIYLAMVQTNFTGEIAKFAFYCNKTLPYESNPWTYRKVEEYINAFRNFGIVVNNTAKKGFFPSVPYTSPLNDFDRQSLLRIYYSYVRFKEVHSWFNHIDVKDRRRAVINLQQNDLIGSGIQLYSFADKSRFTNSFLNKFENDAIIYTLDQESPLARRMMRFWDVYIAWGKSLKVLEKFNLETIDKGLKDKINLSCTYHLSANLPSSNLIEYFKIHFQHRKIFLPYLVSKIALEYRISLESAKEFIVSEYINNREHFTIDNTSEIFFKVSEIKNPESILYPVYRDQYISHITLLQ